MNWLLSTLVTGIVTFAVTNIDDILLLTLFFAQTNARFQGRHVVTGQYLGLMAIVGISLIGFLGSLWIPQQWIGFLGLVPIAIALKQLLTPEEEEAIPDLKELEDETAKPPIWATLVNRHSYSVAAVTLANGGDNIGVYIPLFASSNLPQLIALLCTFFVLTGLWCYLGFYVSRHPAVAPVLERYGHRIVPFVLICLGLYIIVENETLSLFWR